jgi:hypothetical protein
MPGAASAVTMICAARAAFMECVSMQVPAPAARYFLVMMMRRVTGGQYNVLLRLLNKRVLLGNGDLLITLGLLSRHGIGGVDTREKTLPIATVIVE